MKTFYIHLEQHYFNTTL